MARVHPREMMDKWKKKSLLLKEIADSTGLFLLAHVNRIAPVQITFTFSASL